MRILWTVILITVIVILGVWLARGGTVNAPGGDTSPDNGDTPTTPSPLPLASEYTLEAKLNEQASGPGIKITPLAVLEDSRCPIDAVCIQAGTVRIRAKVESGLGTSEMEMSLEKAITSEAETVTLFEVTPVPQSEISIEPDDYIFRFRISNRS